MTQHPGNTADFHDFLEVLRKLEERGQDLQGFLTPGAATSVARAPGRLDLMGGIADYSGALVLQLPIREATWAAAQLAADGDWRIASLPAGGTGLPRCLHLSAAEVRRLRSGSYGEARDFFRRQPEHAWAAYVAGPVLVLSREKRIERDFGLRLLVWSCVPEGKGVSSSAALEVAAMQAAGHCLGVAAEAAETARLCQRAENLVVGAPCGIMDQMTSALGRADHLLALLCQPAEVQGFVPLPEAAGVWGIDSGIRHAVRGSDYVSVRTGAFMGYRIIAAIAGLRAEPAGEPGLVRIEDPRWAGYLANVSPAEFDRQYARHLPQSMRGDEFLRKYGGTTDRVTRVEPDRTYPIRQPTKHPVYEHARVGRFRELLDANAGEESLREMGALMYASHESYSACGLGSDGTDRLVRLVRQAEGAGLYGAKITGGGSGGTVAILGRASAGEAVAEIAQRYRRETGREAYVFCGSSPGACEFGIRALDGP